MHLWDHHQPPPIQHSVIVYKDGGVVEGTDFMDWDIINDTVLLFIPGGSDFRCEDGFVKTSLKAAGYTFEAVA